ncbi:MAG: DnaB-like helicase C-terminal domain-containing protein, partial [Victivallaceae bacterium]
EMYKLTTAISAFKNAAIFIDPTGGLTIAELRAKARRLQLQEKIDMIAIDYLQLMKADSRIESRQQEVAEISSGIKALAKELKIPVLVLAQLNREIEKNASANAKPKLSHLRESGAIEQDADIVTFLHRDRDQAKEINSPDQSVDAELIVEKNRNGQTGYIKLKFFPYRMEFINASRYEDKDLPDGLQKPAEN